MKRSLENLTRILSVTGGRLRIAAAAAAAICLASSCGSPIHRSTNVILISIDTLRADHLGCYGYERPTSPFIDSLAARGVIFENAISQVPGTLPSHMSMLTGLLPTEHDVFPPNRVLSEKIPLIAELAAQAGIRTGGFTEGGYVSGRFGFSRGFEHFDDSHQEQNSDIEDTLRKGLTFIRSIEKSEQFFLFLHTYAVHDPYFPPLPYAANYIERNVPTGLQTPAPIPIGYDLDDVTTARLVEREARQTAAIEFVATILPPDSPLPTGLELEAFNLGMVPIPQNAVPVYEALYDGTINYVDDLLRVFVNRVAELGLDDPTTIIITSDHGEEFLEHGRLGHEQVYDECLHVPLIFVGPGIVAGTRVSNLAMTVDLAPTILDLLGVAPPKNLSGQSLARTVRGNETRKGFEKRTAYARAIIGPIEAVFQLFDGRRFQLVSHSPELLGKDPWIETEVDLFTSGSRFKFKAMSYNRPRVISVQIDGRAWYQLTVTPELHSFELVLPNDGNRHKVTMTADGCESPADVGESDDPRCLAFRLVDVDRRRTVLFDLSSDPNGTTDLTVTFPERSQTMADALNSFHLSAVAPSGTISLDPKTEERLRALGYLK